MHDIFSLFVWLWLVVNDRKFLTGIIFFSHINQPAILLHEPATIRTSRPNELEVTVRPWDAIASSPRAGPAGVLWLYTKKNMRYFLGPFHLPFCCRFDGCHSEDTDNSTVSSPPSG